MDKFLAWILSFFAFLVPGAGQPDVPQYNGYVEADYVYAAPASTGRIEAMDVAEGDRVEKGAVLFTLAADQYRAAVRAAEAREAAARADWQNMETGSRQAEIDVIRASLNQAEADQALAQSNLERTMRLHDQGVVPQARVDQDKATLKSADARVEQLKAQLEVAELPARDAQLAAAKATLDAATADVDKARSDLEDRVVHAPAPGEVQKVFFQAGEVAAAGTPVVSLVPPRALYVKFFIPETARAHFEIGETLDLSCDGCAGGMTATVSFMAVDPEHTPPIIYSRDERARMVFMAKARISDETGLLPGQPVTLTVPQ